MVFRAATSAADLGERPHSPTKAFFSIWYAQRSQLGFSQRYLSRIEAAGQLFFEPSNNNPRNLIVLPDLGYVVSSRQTGDLCGTSGYGTFRTCCAGLTTSAIDPKQKSETTFEQLGYTYESRLATCHAKFLPVERLNDRFTGRSPTSHY